MTNDRPSVAIVVLAAGRSTRMGADTRHKLLATFDGVTLVRRAVSEALASIQSRVIVVTGHRHDEVTGAIAGLSCEIIRNRDHETGMASSLGLGVKAAKRSCPDGVIITLADMPRLSRADFDRLVEAFNRSGKTSIIRAVGDGNPGNPVLFPASLLDDLQRLKGDVGGRALLTANDLAVVDVEIGKAALVDVDTLDDLLSEGGVPTPH